MQHWPLAVAIPRDRDFLGITPPTHPPEILQLVSNGGPLLDRIDIHIEVPAVPFKELATSSEGTSSATMREAVYAAREIQRARFAGTATRSNAQMTTRQIRQHCRLSSGCMDLLHKSVTELGLSARAHDKVLRTARTIADMEAALDIAPAHIQEAVNYRMLDRNLWT